MGTRGSAVIAVGWLCTSFFLGCSSEEPHARAPEPEGGVPDSGSGGQGGARPDAGDEGGVGKGFLVPESACPERVEPSGSGAALPALLESNPVADATGVPRTAWVRLAFDGAVTPADARHIALDCGKRTPSYEVNVVGEGTVVINPCGKLDAGASCRVTWTGASGEQS